MTIATHENYTCKSFIKLTPGCGNDSTYRTTNSFFKQIDSLINGIYRGKLDDLYNIARTPEGLQPHLPVPRMKVRGLKTDVN